MNFKQTMTKTLCTISVAALISSAAFAYFTDQDSKTNTFTVGNVDITVEEPSFPDPEGEDPENEDIVPGDEIPKDPQITNTGKNDAYVYMEVTVPKAKVVTANEDGTKNKAANKQLFSYEINDGWDLLEDQTNETDDAVTYVYAYEQVLKVGEKTNPVFDEVTFVNIVEGQLEGKELVIDVVAKGIQSANTGTYQEAYTKLLNQSK